MRLSYITVAAATAAALAAQDCPRVETQLSTGNVTTSAEGFEAWKTAAPKQNLAGDTALGLAPTARVTYTVFVDDLEGDMVNDLVVRRSVDGGFTFEPAVKIWDANLGDFNGSDIRIEADGHAVYVAFESTGGSVPGAVYQWVAGSDDQGQTWQTITVSNGITNALSTGDVLFDVSNPGQISASDGVCHVAFNANYFSAVGTGGTNSTAEDTFYQAVAFDAGGTLALVYAEEVRMEAYPSGTADSDDPWISADGDLVAVSWQDVSAGGSNTTGNDSYTRVSLDRGATFGGAVNHTNFNGGASGVDTGFTKVEVEGSLVVVVYQGGVPSTIGGSGDRLFASISQDSGANFTQVEVSLGLNDTDNNCLLVRDGRILIGYEEDRTGVDEIYVVVDQNGGADFLGGVVTSDILVSSGAATGNQEIYFADGAGDVLAVSYEPEAGAEGAGFSFSTDGGLTWDLCTAQLNSDVDDLDVAVTINGDVTIVYQFDVGQGNDFNNVYFAGIKGQRLVDNNTSIDYVGGTASEIGDFLFLLPSLTAPTSNGTTVPAGVIAEIGVGYNFVLDPLSEEAFAAGAPLFQGVVGTDGTVNFPIPNLAPVIGRSIYYFGFNADFASGALGRGFTDPIEQR